MAIQPAPIEDELPPVDAGAGGAATVEPADLLKGDDEVAGVGSEGEVMADEEGSDAGVLGVPKPTPEPPPKAATI